MTNIKPFQIFLLGVFVLFAFISLLLLSNFSPSSSKDQNIFGQRVVVWGTLPYEAVSDLFQQIESTNKDFDVVEYFDINEDTFSTELVNAIAEGRSPDLVILPHTQLVEQRGKLLAIPYDTTGFTQRDIKDTYIDGAEIFARPDGLYAIPLMVDPLVMYWNRDLFSSSGLAEAPTTWEQLVNTVTPLMTVQNNNRSIIQSAVAFGEYRNVRNATAVLSMLMLQSGSQMVTESDRGYVVSLNESISGGRPPMEAALQFFTDFSNASNPLYTWNRAQQEDRLAFIAGDLALYFGYGSESSHLQDRNPNLNFDVAPPPQGSTAVIKRTYGVFYGLAIPKASTNQQGALMTARVMGQPENADWLAKKMNIAPVHRSLLAAGSSNAFEQVIYNTALVARGWLMPGPQKTASVFQIMIEDVVSNRARVSDVVNDSIDRLILNY